jgi:signal transduction histidine kinase
MTSWWKKSLAGQFIGFVLAALLAGQTIAFLISSNQREAAIRQAIEGDFVSRTAALSSVLEKLPVQMRHDVLLGNSTGYARFWISTTNPQLDAGAWYRVAQAYLSQRIAELIANNGAADAAILAAAEKSRVGNEDPQLSNWAPLRSSLWQNDSDTVHFLHFSDGEGMGIAKQLNDGTWLNAAYYKPTPPDMLTSQSLLSIGITAAVLSLIGILIANRIARPLRDLALSAEALGRGETVALSPPKGPDDIRQLYESFDRMQLRLRRFIDDRTRMLAAIGHDLRTPLTTLRLRAEFVKDPELQQKILATVDEMQMMTEETLSFVRSEAASEETRTIDVAALLGSLCDDLAELGHDVSFSETDRISYRCRPDNLKRAVRNLIENALRYAGNASVSIQTSQTSIAILVDDDGPGIPASEREQVFAPFYRIEHSRNRETGGVGLGLSIARAIVRHHGGDIVLSPNNPGLRAAVVLPLL